MGTPPDVDVDDWLQRRTIASIDRTIADVTRLKNTAGLGVTVCLPALDEAATIGSICRTIRDDLVEAGAVDELIVVDSGSSDTTLEIAAEAGAVVYSAADILPELAAGVERPGKGEALWKSLAVSTGDIIVWIDSDIRNFSSQFVTRLVWPLLDDPALVMTKSFYERPFDAPADPVRHDPPDRGGRVTELAARPLLQLLVPHLRGVIQPLSGEYALRREAAIALPFVTGYGVDVALVIDVAARFGLDAIAQVDLGARVHRNRDLLTLGRTSFQVLLAMLVRLRDLGAVRLRGEPPAMFVQFVQDRGVTTDLGIAVRPPIATVGTS